MNIPQTPQPIKASLIQKIKSFFVVKDNKENNDDDDIFVNDASFDMPQTQRKQKSIEGFQKVNQTQPTQSVKKQFSIDDDEDDNDFQSHSPKEDKKEKPKLQVQPLPQTQLKLTQKFDGYEEIDVKPLSMPRLIEKDPQKEPYLKGQIINYPPTSTFKVTKVPNVYDSLFEYIIGSVQRDIVLDGGWLYVLKRQGKDKFKVCSSTSLIRLFKVLIKKNDRKPPIKLAFINSSNSVHQMPQIKDYTLINKTQLDLFFIKLRSEVQKHGIDLQFKK